LAADLTSEKRKTDNGFEAQFQAAIAEAAA
jgi:hypothetical protein